MFDSQKRDFSSLLDSVFPIYGVEASKPTKLLWWNLLIEYDLADVAAAFADHLRRGRFAPKPADIIQAIEKLRPDGRPGADEAWSMIPRDEHTSVVWTDEMAEAWSISQPLLDEGDQVAARMAFKEAYTRIVEANKRNSIKPKWFPSLGTDKNGREAVLADAVRLGRISADHAVGLLPPQSVTPMLQSAGVNQIEHQQIDQSMAREGFERMKALVSGLK
jgi:hypothetical protein